MCAAHVLKITLLSRDHEDFNFWNTLQHPNAEIITRSKSARAKKKKKKKKIGKNNKTHTHNINERRSQRLRERMFERNMADVVSFVWFTNLIRQPTHTSSENSLKKSALVRTKKKNMKSNLCATCFLFILFFGYPVFCR